MDQFQRKRKAFAHPSFKVKELNSLKNNSNKKYITKTQVSTETINFFTLSVGGSQNQLSESHICFFSIFNSIFPSNESWYGLGCSEQQRKKPEKATAAYRYQYKKKPLDNLSPFQTSVPPLSQPPPSTPHPQSALKFHSSANMSFSLFATGIIHQSKTWDKIYSKLN